MQAKNDDVPMSIEFPKDILLKKFRRYFTNSISWEIALAIYEGFKEIFIFGVDMATDGEYAFERPSVEYFCGYAEGAGCKLVIPDKSDLLKSFFLYPYEDASTFKIKMDARRAELDQRVAELSAQEQHIRDQKNQMIGARSDNDYVDRCWFNHIKEMGAL
jgi:hypothetical protein